jgi:hypothetical protein
MSLCRLSFTFVSSQAGVFFTPTVKRSREGEVSHGPHSSLGEHARTFGQPGRISDSQLLAAVVLLQAAIIVGAVSCALCYHTFQVKLIGVPGVRYDSTKRDPILLKT